MRFYKIAAHPVNHKAHWLRNARPDL